MLHKVSIIMPVYNSEHTVKKAIESIVMQTYKKIEIIIIDDGSNDNTFDICNSYNDDRIKVLKKKNGGPSSSRNLGIRNATGEYIMFIDSDDEYEKTCVEKMCNVIQNYELVCCNLYKTRNNKKYLNNIKDCQYQDLINFLEENQRNTIFNGVVNKIYKRDIILKEKIFFDETIHFGEDMEFNIEYLKFVKNAFVIGEPLYNYNIRKTSISYNYRENDFDVRLHNIKKLEELYDLKNNNKSFIIEKYIEAFIQSSTVDINKFKSKQVILQRINKYIDIINLKLDEDKVYIIRLEDRIIYELIRGVKVKKIYFYLWLRNMIKKVILNR